MSDDISLLPEEQRKKEEELKHPEATKAPVEEKLAFTVPKAEGEDVEVIEIDEGEIEQVLASEPPLTRLAYKAAAFFQSLGHKLFAPHEPEPPPKLPPQFFKAPPEKPKPVPAPMPPAAPFAAIPSVSLEAPSLIPPAAPAKPKAKIMPLTEPERRVRVIKRVRKPIHVSFVSEEDLRLQRIDVPKRKFTFIATMLLFAVLLGGGYYLLGQQVQAADAELTKAKAQFDDVGKQIADRQAAWTAFQDLEPRLKALTGLLDRHVSPTKLFEELEQRTSSKVSYDSFALTPDGHVTLQVSTDSFQTAAEQLVAFQTAGFVKQAEAAGYSVTYDPPESFNLKAVRFQLNLTLSDEAMRVTPVAAN